MKIDPFQANTEGYKNVLSVGHILVRVIKIWHNPNLTAIFCCAFGVGKYENPWAKDTIPHVLATRDLTQNQCIIVSDPWQLQGRSVTDSTSFR